MNATLNKPTVTHQSHWVVNNKSPGRLIVWSPRKRRLAILRRYQALGKARISLSRLMSYLKDAEPMSHTATGRILHLFRYKKHRQCKHIGGIRSLKQIYRGKRILTFRDWKGAFFIYHAPQSHFYACKMSHLLLHGLIDIRTFQTQSRGRNYSNGASDKFLRLCQETYFISPVFSSVVFHLFIYGQYSKPTKK